MLSCYSSSGVQFAARPEASIAGTEKWIAAQVSINKVSEDSRWLLVQEKSDVGAKILYSAVISKKVKLALEEHSMTIILCHPRTTPMEVNEYKLKFEHRFDFWCYLSIYTKTLQQGVTVSAEQSGNLNNIANDAMSMLTEALTQGASTEQVVLTQQGGGSGDDPMDLYTLLGGQLGTG